MVSTSILERLFPQKTLPFIPVDLYVSRTQLLELIITYLEHLTVKRSTWSRYIKSYRVKGKRGVYYFWRDVLNLFDRHFRDLFEGDVR